MLKKILFPFKASRPSLNQYWWHRLLVVLFAIAVLSSGIYVWQTTLQSGESGFSSCLMLADDVSDQGYSHTSLAQNEASCEISNPIYAGPDFGFGVLVAILTFYLLQLIYYKVVLYVVFSPAKKNSEGV